METLGPDGEYFADVPQNPIPTKDTWQNLSVKELYEVKSQLETKLYDFYSNPVISRVLTQSVSEISELISFRENSAF